MLRISENKRTFEKDGKPFFYLADTCWSAFTNISDEEWTYYLKRRKQQGFNTIQINILPQWDASETPYHYYPLPTEDKKLLRLPHGIKRILHVQEQCVNRRNNRDLN